MIGLVSLQLNSVAAQGWGTVTGRVVWAGNDIPKRAPVNLKDNMDGPKCLAAAKGQLLSELWVVNPKNKGVRWVFVWLEPADGGVLPIHPDLAPVPKEPVEIDQPCCQYVPHAVGLRQGQDLLVKNSATFSHSVKWSGHPARNPGSNVLLSAGTSRTIKGLVTDRVPVKVECALHGWMNAQVRVFDHPYFVVTDEDGGFEIPKAPAGQYRLIVWHEAGYLGGAAGKKGMSITIMAGKVTDTGTLDWKP
jgi:hypothetical protein